MSVRNRRRWHKERLYLTEFLRWFHDIPVSIIDNNSCLGQFWNVDVVEIRMNLLHLFPGNIRDFRILFPFDNLVPKISERQCPVVSEEQIEDCTTAIVRE
ncbi:hypothetical protein C489_12502 [Natrinema versiforme JCM 10478]|uniref:Uncharacterized protein n=1 Tax=Natrinema versiforme JCM 10478 TaxID=1227496 RepID=L9Y1V5_9EURY|nr:hypothetical protein C489_12502 [Natrinema versiforme JCM 10478]